MKPQPALTLGMLALLLVAFGAAPASAVEVLRGTRAAVVATGEARAKVPADNKAADRTLLAGERLWIHDAASGRVAACTLRKTTQVGGWRVSCYGE
ncbi:MAG: hypothetical protein KIT81_00390 [Alphaproteobacteria bacterium]|nr:hypothetical protein [Alphaproteobacteria bacterium]